MKRLTRVTLYPLVVILAFCVLATGLWFRPSISRMLDVTTTGSIYVSGPQIYTRERLVNDRYREDTWLSEELKKSPDLPFDVSMSTSILRSDVVGIGAAVGKDKDAAAPDRSKPETQAARDIKISQQDRFNAVRAYREQVRALMIENQLDDRHDLRGNSLYRLHFDAAVIPGANTRTGARVTVSILPPDNLLTPPKTESWTDAEVRDAEDMLSKLGSLDELKPQQKAVWTRMYVRWLASLTKRFEESRKSVRLAYESNRFAYRDYQLLLDAAKQEAEAAWSNLKLVQNGPIDAQNNISADDKEAMRRGLTPVNFLPGEMKAMEDMRSAEGRNQRVDSSDPAHSAFKHALQDRIDAANQAITIMQKLSVSKPNTGTEIQACKDIQAYNSGSYDSSSAQLISWQSIADRSFEPSIFNTVLGLGLDWIATSDTLRKFASSNTSYGAIGTAYKFEQQIPSLFITNDPKCLSVDAGMPYDIGGQVVYVSRAQLDLIRYFLPDYDPMIQLKQVIRRNSSGPDRSGSWSDTITVNTGLINFIRMAGRQLDVFSYAFTPSEPDELSAVEIRGDNARILDAEVGAAAMGKAASAALKAERDAIETRKRNDLRKLVVSFGEQINSVTARFGWVIQPQELLDDGGYRHRASETSLTALVSLPAWWEEMRVKVDVSWDDRPATQPQQQYVIILPVNFETVDATLFENIDRSPVITDWVMGGLTVTPCRKTELMIPGRRLWRSTVVTLGGQRADGIYVMPDMNGIVATFDTLDYPSTWNGSSEEFKAPLIVWTSEGSAPPQWVTFQKAEGPAGKCVKAASSEGAMDAHLKTTVPKSP